MLQHFTHTALMIEDPQIALKANQFEKTGLIWANHRMLDPDKKRETKE